MTYGVFDQRLKQQTRHQRVANPILDVAVDGEAVLKTHALDCDVAVEETELALQRHFLLARRRQNQPQEITELRNHALRRGRIRRDESHCAIQRVEKKVRIELELERVELRLNEPRDYSLALG